MGDVAKFDSFSPQHFIHGSRALGALVLVLAMVKPMTNMVCVFIKAYKLGRKDANIAFRS